jgi:hypothetical protein
MGGSGGGGNSGKVEYPAYMMAIHGKFLDSSGADTPTYSVTDIMNAAWSANPFTGLTTYDPDLDIASALTYLVTFGGLSLPTSLSDAITHLVGTATTAVDDTILDLVTTTERTQELMDAYADQLDADIAAKALPVFQRGMQDINAVMSSAFVIGEALILAERNRNVAKFNAELMFKAYQVRAELIPRVAELQLKYFATYSEYMRSVAHLFVEFYRIKIVAKKEEQDTQQHIDEAEAKWDIELYQYASNVLAGIAGSGHVVPGKPNKVASALGGALSGAASGASMGAMAGPYGAAAGAVIGGIAGAFM